ncbi:hypothetical protein ACFV5G_07395 [Streptomyces sp. NPDC059766]|uniref:hypothetical protein n=1 Tax=Streptomyces sp. NPDC059766 TaxID=3346940 RepID=UPI00364C96D0
MPTFRQPDWQQQADRHTEIVDPVLTVRQLSRFDFNLKSYVRIDHALVFSTAKGGYEPYLPPRRPTRAEVLANHYTAVYEVDMGVHPHTCNLELPSDNDAFEFTAAVDISWQVIDPARFVASGHRDVPGLVLSELQQAARPVTRRFPIAESAAAEAELLERMNLLGPLGAPAGLQVTWTLRLRRDEDDIEHQRRMRSIDQSASEQILAAQRGMDIDVEVDRRGRQSDALQIERAMQYGAHQQELILQQQRMQHAQALLAGEQQMQLQQLEAEKARFYAWHLQQGGVHAWALHLAQHPEDSAAVMNSMREDQLRMIQSQMELVKQLLGGDGAENWELEGPKQLALRTVNDILTQRLPGVPQDPPQLPGGAPVYPGSAIPQGGAPDPGTAGVPGLPGDGGPGWPSAQHPGGYAAPTGPYGAPGTPGAPGAPAAPAPGPYGVPGTPGPGPYGSGPYGSGPYGAPGAPGTPPYVVPGTPGTPPHAVPGAPGSPSYGVPGTPVSPSQGVPGAPAAPAVAPAMPAAPAMPPAPAAPPGAAQRPPFPPAAGGPDALPPASPPPPAYAPAAPAGAPDPYPGAPAPGPATLAAPAGPPEAPAWQPPPGYGRTPTLPARTVPEVPAAAHRDDGDNDIEPGDKNPADRVEGSGG